jgi:DNA-binding transcriptional LysR family regulator
MKGLDELYLFKTIVDCGGISAAGRHLCLPKSTLARRLNELEQRLGMALFHRGPRRFLLTSFGRECYAQSSRMVWEADKVFDMADRARQTPSGSLHLICPPLLGTLVIEQLVAEFMEAAPRVRLHLEETAWIIDPRLASADLIIHGAFEPLPDLDVIARRIVSCPYRLVAHPRILQGGVPRVPQELTDFDGIGFGPKTTPWTWRLQRGKESCSVAFEPRFSSTQLSAVIKAARLGIGIASLPSAVCQEDIDTGRLVAVLEEWAAPSAKIYAVYPSRRTLSMAAERFLELIEKRLPTLLGLDDSATA